MSIVTVITPTTGAPELAHAVASVYEQTRLPDRHIIISDGIAFFEQSKRTARSGWTGRGRPPVTYAVPDNTGAGDYYGHRIYANFTQMLDTDYVLLLDQDNTYDQAHVETLIPIAERHGFAYSLRGVYDRAGAKIGEDREESIGKPNRFGYTLVDTSCWCVRRDHIPMLRAIDGGWGADRELTRAFTERYGDDLTFACSGIATMRYTAPERLEQFFREICT